ncbi:MAG: type I-E CRISPR-associated protein Cas7/Cse4/CasC [Cellvibrionales bacterium]|nr:type I-E CRISPR-associated protein Cas7/Cse4/CasC [Cellvibrionales bacterium]
MNRFIQLHYLTIYPLSNPNRDEQGRPKSATYGGQPRLRISSQALKRAARLSDAMQDALAGHLGERTQRIGEEIRKTLKEEGVDGQQAEELATAIADVFGKLDEKAAKKGQIRTKQLAFISPDERACAIDLARKAAAGEPLPDNAELKKRILRPADGAADVAMFGRMLAGDPDFNREAAVQVSHALTTHRAVVEDDFYTAVDDLKTPSEDAGAGFVGEAGFGSGVFYTYACVDVNLLRENLEGDTDLAARAAGALAAALATATPSGKRNAFAHQTCASYLRAEAGERQPRSLAGAFFTPVAGKDLLQASINALQDTERQMTKAYFNGQSEKSAIMNVPAEQGSLDAIREFVEAAVRDA